MRLVFCTCQRPHAGERKLQGEREREREIGVRKDVLSVLSFKGQVEGDRRYITMSYRDGSTARMLLKGVLRFNDSALFIDLSFCGVGNMQGK